MLVAVTLIMAALVAAGLLTVARERQGLAPVTLYCPLHETVVSVKGDCCFAEGTLAPSIRSGTVSASV
jgi:hypothetical protein